jgi:hypothetical protein
VQSNRLVAGPGAALGQLGLTSGLVSSWGREHLFCGCPLSMPHRGTRLYGALRGRPVDTAP